MGNQKRIARTLAFLSAAFAISLHATTDGSAQTRAHPESGAIVHQNIVMKRGESLDVVLRRAGINANERKTAEKTLAATRSPRQLAAGSHVILTFRRGRGSALQLLALHIDLDKNADVTLVAHADDATAVQPRSPSAGSSHAVAPSDLHSVSGVVGPAFQASLLAAGLATNVAQDIHSVFAYDPDFPAKPPAGSRFDVVVETSPGRAVATESLQSVTITIHGRRHSVYRYPVGNGLVAFVEPNGRGVLQAHLAAPVADARVSSPWGWRIHPILDRPEFHKGIDMAAPIGTPVLAAADGTVAFAGHRGNNGVLIKLTHTGQLMTAYSHLERIAVGIHAGSHVTKGQVIGYVGETGLATGPHLYYEVYIAGQQVNPAKSNFAVPIHLAGGDLRRLQKLVLADARKSPQ